jgi:hypothetical protein
MTRLAFAIRSCDHSGTHSPYGQYVRETAEIRYVTVCDGCGVEIREVMRESYTPNFDPAGNDPYILSPVAG